MRTIAATLLCLSLLALTASAAPAKLTRCRLAWRPVPSPRYSGGSLTSVDALKPNLVWAAGSGIDPSGRILVERWDGRRWDATLLSETGVVRGLAARSSSDVWLVGQARDYTPLILHYDGTAWSQLPSPLPAQELGDVIALGPRDAWAVGVKAHDLGPDGNASALILHWDGSRWSSVAGPAGLGALSGVSALSARDLWAVGPVASSSFSPPMVVHWNGTSWRRVAEDGLGYVDLFRVAAVSARNVWAIGATDGTERRGIVVHWNGARWRTVDQRTLRSGVESFNGIAAYGHSVWAVGGWAIDRWEGRRWLKRPFRGVTFDSADALSARNVWAVGGDRRGPVVYHYACS